MSVSPTSGSPLPPAISSFIKRGAVHGAPLPLVELNTRVPARPIELDNGGAYTLTIYGGPFMHFTVSPKLGGLVSAVA